MARKPTTLTDVQSNDAMQARQRLHGLCVMLASEHTNARIVAAYREASKAYAQHREGLSHQQLRKHDREWSLHSCSSIACPHAKQIMAELKSP